MSPHEQTFFLQASVGVHVLVRDWCRRGPPRMPQSDIPKGTGGAGTRSDFILVVFAGQFHCSPCQNVQYCTRHPESKVDV